MGLCYTMTFDSTWMLGQWRPERRYEPKPRGLYCRMLLLKRYRQCIHRPILLLRSYMPHGIDKSYWQQTIPSAYYVFLLGLPKRSEMYEKLPANSGPLCPKRGNPHPIRILWAQYNLRLVQRQAQIARCQDGLVRSWHNVGLSL